MLHQQVSIGFQLEVRDIFLESQGTSFYNGCTEVIIKLCLSPVALRLRDQTRDLPHLEGLISFHEEHSKILLEEARLNLVIVLESTLYYTKRYV